MAPLDFGFFYEIPVAAPWHERSERDAYHRVIDQAVLGEQVGFSHFWTVEHLIVGDPETCIRKVKRYREAGCDQLLCLMQPYDIPADAVTRSIELFGRYVIPAFR